MLYPAQFRVMPLEPIVIPGLPGLLEEQFMLPVSVVFAVIVLPQVGWVA